MNVASFPYLEALVGGYFHQDCYASGVTVDDTLRDFRSTSHDYQRLGVRADIHRLLHEHRDQLLYVIEKTLQPSIIIGETRAEAEAWLSKVANALED